MTGHNYWASPMCENMVQSLYSFHAYTPHNYYPHFAKRGTVRPWVNLLKHTVSGITEPQTRPTHALPTVTSLCHAAFAIRIADQGSFWASWQGFLTSFILPRPSQKENWERETWGAARNSPVLPTQRTWMWSRWDPDTHPRLTLSCSAL